MKFRETFRRFASNIHTWSRTKKIAVIGVIATGIYALTVFVPSHVAFSYATPSSCINRIVLFPATFQDSSDIFDVSFQNAITIGSLPVAATKLCFTPTAAPTPGTVHISASQWGFAPFTGRYAIKVGALPQVTAAPAPTLAITKPLTFALDQADTVFDYSVRAEGESKTSTCSVLNTSISCNLKELQLEQGADHTVLLQRRFDATKIEILDTTTVSILPAVTIEDSSVKDTATLYDQPSHISIIADKQLVSATAKLWKIDDGKDSVVPVSTSIEGTTVRITPEEQLERKTQFRLTLIEAEASDGSTVPEPYTLNFTTSGGPKVTNVNIGASGVDPNAKITVTFDQPLANDVAITDFAHISGATATIGKQGATVVFGLKNANRCASFTLSINKGLKSGSNTLTSEEDWTYTSRINCKSTAIIGYSVKGRPIIAYYYGGGPTTVLFTGGMHGSEPSGTTTMQAWATHLDSNAHKIPSDKQVVIVPNTNPDGIAAGSRYNANNVNLARNFTTRDWKADIETSSGVIKNGGGSAPMSEPETRALATLTSQLNPRLVLSFHAQGRLVGANDYADSRTIGSTYASIVGYRTMFGNQAEEIMGYGFSGQYDDWIGEKLGKPSILIELPAHKGNYFSSQQTALWRMVNL